MIQEVRAKKKRPRQRLEKIQVMSNEKIEKMMKKRKRKATKKMQ